MIHIRHAPKTPWSARLAIFYYRMRAAFILWRQRERAGLSTAAAARLVGIDRRKLRRYECGLESPPLCVIHALLTAYNAEPSAILFFCTIPFPAPSLSQWIRWRWRGLALLLSDDATKGYSLKF